MIFLFLFLNLKIYYLFLGFQSLMGRDQKAD
jgi:hypothetical protein